MKKFKFKFQTILDLRARELEKAELKLAEAKREVLNAKKILTNLHQELKNNKAALEEIISSGLKIDIFNINNYQNYLRTLDRKIDLQHTIIENLESKAEKARQEMLITRQKKLMMEKLKEKDFKTYVNDYEVQDHKLIDEIATNKHSRK